MIFIEWETSINHVNQEWGGPGPGVFVEGPRGLKPDTFLMVHE